MLNTPAETFIKYLKNYHTNLNVFIKLFNLWSELTPKERQEIINKELITNL